VNVEGLFTRESDWNGDFKIMLWDIYCDQITDGALTLERATEMYLDDIKQMEE